jgi:hypothetical protein
VRTGSPATNTGFPSEQASASIDSLSAVRTSASAQASSPTEGLSGSSGRQVWTSAASGTERQSARVAAGESRRLVVTSSDPPSRVAKRWASAPRAAAVAGERAYWPEVPPTSSAIRGAGSASKSAAKRRLAAAIRSGVMRCTGVSVSMRRGWAGSRV